MKKIAKLLTLLLIVATVATGIAFVASADYVSQGSGNGPSEALIFGGTKTGTEWNLEPTAYSKYAGNRSLKNGENAVWLSFDYLYDELSKNSALYIRIQTGAGGWTDNIMQIKQGNVNLWYNATPGENAYWTVKDCFNKGEGWYHFDISIEQHHEVDPETGDVSYSLIASIYRNGELMKEYPFNPTKTDYRFYDVAVDAEGNETVTLRTTGNAGARFFIAGSLDNSQYFTWIKGYEGGVGNTPASSVVNLAYSWYNAMPVWTYNTADFNWSDFPSTYYNFKGDTAYNPYDAVYNIHKDVNTYATVGGETVLPVPIKAGYVFTGWTVVENYATARVEGNTLIVDANHSGAISLEANFIQLPELKVDLLDGASVRMNTPSGLRFETTVSKAMIDQIAAIDGASFKVGTLIVPTDKLGSTNFTKADLDAADIDYAELTTDLKNAEAENGVYTVYASLTNIRPENYTRKFSAISYIEVKIGDETYLVYDEYVEADNARSVYDVAYRLLTETDATNAVLKSFVDKVVVLDASLAVCNTVADKYESPYTATYADGTLTVSRVDGEAITAENLSTVVIDGVSYTGGWQLVDGNLVASYTLAE